MKCFYFLIKLSLLIVHLANGIAVVFTNFKKKRAENREKKYIRKLVGKPSIDFPEIHTVTENMWSGKLSLLIPLCALT
jgi:hypothetical protein